MSFPVKSDILCMSISSEISIDKVRDKTLQILLKFIKYTIKG
jgi:hypothetical protein